ncbi:c-type cytochrome [Bernardetia sp. ABR2-2B]|uniref:c-type cytochrome n=1 Tax=Bernardetia sp. ABR2-2B TaxID=3127472 RepID=UPI0030CCF852
MNTNLLYIALFISFLVMSCSDSKKETNTTSSPKEEITQTSQKEVEKVLTPEEELVKGLQLMEANCYSCHSPSASQAVASAPPMEAVKRHYIKEGTTQEEFTKELIAFVSNPSKEKAKMKHAVERFGVMSKMNFSEEKLKKIANYIYNSELEKPDWFEEHYKSRHKGKGN